MHAVIIGTGGAGVSAIRTIRSLDEECKITAISKEKFLPYSPCSLPHMIAGEIDEKSIFRVRKDFFRKSRVRALFGRTVSRILARERAILVDGKKMSYDKLLVAAGSNPLRPSIPGIDLKGVYTLGNMTDAKQIMKWIEGGAKRAVVLGAGFIGVECAIALRKLGLEVSVYEMLDTVLPRMLDEDMSLEVERLLEKEGICFHLGSKVSEILGENRVEGVVSGRKRSPCDMVVLGIGVRPNIGFLKGSGIRTNSGVLVDAYLRTSVEDIYAAGDIVETEDRILRKRKVSAIWPNAVEQGRVAGYNMAGVRKRYEGLESINILDIYGVPVLSIGLSSSELKGFEIEKVKTNRAVKKLLLKDGRILGLQMIGTVRNSGYFLTLAKKGVEIEKVRGQLLADRFLPSTLRS